MYLRLTIYEVLFLHAALETLVEEMQSMFLDCDKEKALLKKIYLVSSSIDRKFPELIK